GLGINLDLGDMAAVRERVRHLDTGLAVEILLPGNLEQRHAPVGAGDLEMTAGVDEVARGRLEHLRRDGPRLPDHFFDRADNRRARGQGPGGGRGPRAGPAEPRVALLYDPAFLGNAEPIRREPAEYGAVPLSRRLCPERHHDGAVAGKADRRGLVGL